DVILAYLECRDLAADVHREIQCIDAGYDAVGRILALIAVDGSEAGAVQHDGLVRYSRRVEPVGDKAAGGAQLLNERGSVADAGTSAGLGEGELAERLRHDVDGPRLRAS